jgi:hypothetical protein
LRLPSNEAAVSEAKQAAAKRYGAIVTNSAHPRLFVQYSRRIPCLFICQKSCTAIPLRPSQTCTSTSCQECELPFRTVTRPEKVFRPMRLIVLSVCIRYLLSPECCRCVVRMCENGELALVDLELTLVTAVVRGTCSRVI